MCARTHARTRAHTHKINVELATECLVPQHLVHGQKRELQYLLKMLIYMSCTIS